MPEEVLIPAPVSTRKGCSVISGKSVSRAALTCGSGMGRSPASMNGIPRSTAIKARHEIPRGAQHAFSQCGLATFFLDSFQEGFFFSAIVAGDVEKSFPGIEEHDARLVF